MDTYYFLISHSDRLAYLVKAKNPRIREREKVGVQVSTRFLFIEEFQ
jgi:hypothetical protein